MPLPEQSKESENREKNLRHKIGPIHEKEAKALTANSNRNREMQAPVRDDKTGDA